MSPVPVLVPKDATSVSHICDACVAEKNSPFVPGRAWARGEDLDDVTVVVELALDQDETWFECDHGHRNLAVRAGSERARNFGY